MTFLIAKCLFIRYDKPPLFFSCCSNPSLFRVVDKPWYSMIKVSISGFWPCFIIASSCKGHETSLFLWETIKCATCYTGLAFTRLQYQISSVDFPQRNGGFVRYALDYQRVLSPKSRAELGNVRSWILLDSTISGREDFLSCSPFRGRVTLSSLKLAAFHRRSYF